MESLRDSSTFCCSIAQCSEQLIVGCDCTESGCSGSVVRELVVRVIVKLMIAAPAGVGIVENEVIWMGLYSDSLASCASRAAFRTVTNLRQTEPSVF